MFRYLLPVSLLLTQQLDPRVPDPSSADSRERKVYDEGQVQVPPEGQVETLPDGQVEPVHPTAVQEPASEPQRDLFQFETRSFNPVPNPD